MKTILITLMITLTGLQTISAQCFTPEDNNTQYGADSASCVRNLSLYGEYYKQNNYEMAIEGWRKAIMKCPRSSKNLYIHGAKILDHFIEKAQDEAKRDAYIDTLLCLYDHRIKFFGQEGYVLGKKGSDVLTLKKNAQESYDLLKKSIEMQGNESEATPLVYYMQSACALLGREKITKEEALDVFQKVSGIIDHNLAKDPGNKFYTAAQGHVEKIFMSCHGIAECETMIPVFKPKYEQHKSDTIWLKKVGGLLSVQKCNSDPFFETVAKRLCELQPSAECHRMIAQLRVEQKDCSGAIENLKKAIDMESDDVKNANDMLLIAKCYAINKQFAQAKSWAIKATGTKSGWGDPYISIAQWCAASSSGCGDNTCTERAAYWVAVDYLEKARSVDGSVSSEAAKLIARYKESFPSKEECFFHNVKEGDEISVGCWINETTKARF